MTLKSRVFLPQVGRVRGQLSVQTRNPGDDTGLASSSRKTSEMPLIVKRERWKWDPEPALLVVAMALLPEGDREWPTLGWSDPIQPMRLCWDHTQHRT